MPTLENFTQFTGRYWDTASIRNALDYQGVKAPHTGEPFTEAMLLGISGGVTFGYFTFHYKGYDPQVNLLTRNTFDPMGKIFERMGIPVTKKQTASADKGRQNLIQALEDGYAPIASPDGSLLPYNAIGYDQANWYTMPLVIFGYEPEKGEACISDRSKVPLTVTTDELDAARSRIKKDRQRLLLLGEPDESKLVDAVKAGMVDCVKLMTEKPPKGSAKRFGFKGLEHWGDMLFDKGRGSWQKEYNSGRPGMAALTSAYTFLSPAFGKTVYVDRDVYADFLDEAALLLGEPELNDVADDYRMAGEFWADVSFYLLPEFVPLLSQARQAIDRKAELFIEGGAANLDDIIKQRDQLEQLTERSETGGRLNEKDFAGVCFTLRDKLMWVERYEWDAVEALQKVVDRIA